MDYQDRKTSAQFTAPGDRTKTSIDVFEGSPVVNEHLSSEDYNLGYACLVIPRFEKHALQGDLADFIQKQMKRICATFGWKLESMDLQPKYLQWVIVVPASAPPNHFMQIIVQQTSKLIFEQFPSLRRESSSNQFWAAEYLVMAGLLPYSPEMINQFIYVTRKQQGNLSRVAELLRGMFELLWTRPDGRSSRDLMAMLPEVTQLTEYEKTYDPSSSMPQYERMLRLATIPLVKAGWLVRNSTGRWYITDEGRQACKSYSNPEELYKNALAFLEERRQNAPLYNLVAEDAEEKAWGQIQKFLLDTKRTEFLSLVADLLIAMGYHIGWIAPPEKNHGQIDMVALVDPIGAKGQRILVQVRHKGQALTVEGLKSFSSILSSNDYGLCVSTGGFTNDALQEASSDTFLKTTLWNLENFFDMWIAYQSKLSQNAQTRLPLKAIYFLYGLE